MLGDSSNCVFTGAIGKDEFGRLLMKQCDEARVESLLYVQQEEPTSTCAALINGNEGHRSMVSHLSGANTYPKDYLLQGEKTHIACGIVTYPHSFEIRELTFDIYKSQKSLNFVLLKIRPPISFLH